MAHFLAIPVKKDPATRDPHFNKLPLYHSSGLGAIAAWGIGPEWQIRAEDRSRFIAERYRTTGTIGYFMLRGLVAGDKIAVFDTNNKQQTAWMPISFSGDTSGMAVVKKIAGKPEITLDPSKLKHGVYPIAEPVWLDWVEGCINLIRTNPAGCAVLGSIKTPVRICPFLGAEINANSTIQFSPHIYARNYSPGSRPNEVLFHEFCHVADDDYDGYSDRTITESGGAGPLSADDSFTFGSADYFSVTGTNLYCSYVKRPLRKDWIGSEELPYKYRADARLYANWTRSNLNNFKGRKPLLYQALKKISVPWNPFAW